ncbi:MAG: TIM barrel protein, partial [Clostridia bacterium]|nr:TIM barrel protein [Clostridia bacterium]
MKLSFSTNRWKGFEFEDFIKMALDYRFDGIEIHSVNELGQDLSARFRALTENRLRVPCIDLVGDIGDKKAQAQNMGELLACLKAARTLRIPYVRLRAYKREGADEAAREFLTGALEEASKDGVVLLVETVGLYADTAHLRELLNFFASDSLGALWDLAYPFLENAESAQDTITNLGAYVRHVHAKDAEEKGVFTLVGEGRLPLRDFVRALGSVNYDGFVSLEWDPEWIGELSDVHVIFPHFQNYMSRLEDTRRSAPALYSNRAGTGKAIWKKDVLIEKTFPQVLDAMCEAFPDQYAFKYTTLDYTRTYSTFRDDVDTFAASLIALGV